MTRSGLVASLLSCSILVSAASAAAAASAPDLSGAWARTTPQMNLILGGLLEGKKQNEIAVDAGINRFRVIRMVAGLQRQFATAA